MADVDDAFRIYSDSEVMRYLGGNSVPFANLEDARQRLSKLVDGNPPDAKLANRAIERKEDKRVIGTLILKPFPESQDVEIGWHLAQDCWGNGYATEAAKGGLDYAFNRAGVEELFAIVLPENTKSIHVAQRLGMKDMGMTDRYFNLYAKLFHISLAEFLHQDEA
ncbi:MAG: hypothetical protein HONBIEJF_02218 [Fimbriimonadaceae bacterium]|nr:hypothetical protein [Fimbriimonadaceae bacterium]